MVVLVDFDQCASQAKRIKVTSPMRSAALKITRRPSKIPSSTGAEDEGSAPSGARFSAIRVCSRLKRPPVPPVAAEDGFDDDESEMRCCCSCTVLLTRLPDSGGEEEALPALFVRSWDSDSLFHPFCGCPPLPSAKTADGVVKKTPSRRSRGEREQVFIFFAIRYAKLNEWAAQFCRDSIPGPKIKIRKRIWIR